MATKVTTTELTHDHSGRLVKQVVTEVTDPGTPHVNGVTNEIVVNVAGGDAGSVAREIQRLLLNAREARGIRISVG